MAATKEKTTLWNDSSRDVQQPLTISDGTTERTALFGSARLNLALIGFLGCAIVYALRTDVSFAIVCMVNGTAVESLSASDGSQTNTKAVCEGSSVLNRNDTEPKIEGSLFWPKKTQGYVLSAFFWGYICSQILGGYTAGKYGGRIVLGISVFTSSLITLISPIAANMSVYLFIALRGALGFVQGATIPGFHTMWSLWAPPLERTILTGITYAGCQVGNVLVMPLSGILCKYGFAGGWPSIFYILAIVGLAWTAVWFIIAADRPSTSRFISEAELEYIESSLNPDSNRKTVSTKKKMAVPWMSIMESSAVWGLLAGHFAGDWGAYIMMTSLPIFMNDVLGFDLSSLGFLAAIPYIAYFICINLGGVLADQIRNKGLLSTIGTRRLAMIVALGGQGIFLLISGYCGCGQERLVILFLTLGIGISGFQYAGFVVNYLDIAPAYCGPIVGIGNTISCIAGVVSPLLVGWLTPTGSREEWQLVFWITGGVLLAGVIAFCVFAKGEVQEWAKPKNDDEKDEERKGLNNTL